LSPAQPRALAIAHLHPRTDRYFTALLAVDEALEHFAACDPRKAELVKLRYFTGMSFEEAASVLGIAVPTAKKWWVYGRAWLAVALRPSLEIGGAASPSPVGDEKNA
jgi:DNA-directed RNA polymerase specialized sigma24 family protein